MLIKKAISDYQDDLIQAINNLDTKEIEKFLNLLKEAYDRGSYIYIFGNGGSASTASHFACDLNKGVSFHTEKKFRVIPLTDNLPTILAYANDVNYEDVFIEQLKNFLKPDDIAIGISGSGNSGNILKAIEYANKCNAITIGITGYDGGRLKKAAKYSVNANIGNMQISEDIHVILFHLSMSVLMKMID